MRNSTDAKSRKSKIRIVTDSTSSIPREIREERRIEMLSLFVNRGGEEHVEAEMDLDAFYKDIYEMVDDIPVSSQPSPAAIRSVLREAAMASEHVLGIFLSEKMSGTYASVASAAKEVKAEFPEFEYVLIDSMSNCMEMGWAVLTAAEARDAGGSLEECAAAAVESIRSTRFIFAPESLRFLKAGGRIGTASALLGSVLSISPILTVSNGEAATHSKVRTQKTAMRRMLAIFKKDVAAHGLKNVCVHYIGSRELAAKWAKEEVEPFVGGEVLVAPASPVIGCHVGPSVGLAYELASCLPEKAGVTIPMIAS